MTSNVSLATTPHQIYVPTYLKRYLDSLIVPGDISMDFLLKIGEELLNEKIADVEAYNMTGLGNKKRIPEKLDFDEVAIVMMSVFTFRNIQMTTRVGDTMLGLYDNDPQSSGYGTYHTSIDYMYRVMERLAPKFKNRDMDDVIDKITRSVPILKQTKSKHLFAVNNGIYDKSSGQVLDFDPEYIFLTKIPVDYKHNPINPSIQGPDFTHWDVESWIMDLTDGDVELTTLIWQVIADCLQPSYSRGKSVWFYSEKGNNGKGTIGQLIKNLLGDGNYSSLSVADFNHEFLKETLLGVAANIADENDVDIFIDSIKDYKASVTGDDINVNRKYEKSLRIQFTGTNLQMMNGLPKTKDKSDSFYRRLILVPFLKSFTNNGEKKYIKSDYINRTEVLEYVLNKALNIEFDEYIVPAASAELMESYKEKNNPVLEFWNELKDEFVWDLLPTQFLYDLFIKWFAINNPSGKVMAKRSFTDSLNAVLNSQGDPWAIKTSQSDKVRPGTKMDADEPLITQFGLDVAHKDGRPTEWMNPKAGGGNAQKRREFTRKQSYRGYVRM